MILELILGASGEPFSCFFDGNFELYSGIDFLKDFRMYFGVFLDDFGMLLG